MNGVNSAGAILGCLTSAYTADKVTRPQHTFLAELTGCDVLQYSRKRTIQLGCIILIIGGSLCSGSVSIGMFYAGRVVAGIGAGILAVRLMTIYAERVADLQCSDQVVVPMYQVQIRRVRLGYFASADPFLREKSLQLRLEVR